MKIAARDHVDIEHLEAMQRSAGWQLFRTRVEEMLAGQIDELQGDQDPTETAHTRGFIRGIRSCMDIPGILKHEVLEREKAKETRR